MKLSLTALLLIIGFFGVSQGTFSVISGMNVCVSTPPNYTTVKKYPTLIFVPGAGEIGMDKNLLVKYGPNAYVKQGFNNTAGGQQFILISIQPVGAYPRPTEFKPVIANLIANYAIDTSKLYGTGLSRGAWNINNYGLYMPTLTDFSYVKTFKAIVNYAGQRPDDNFGVNQKYPIGFQTYAAQGGKYLGIEQKYDGRDIQTIVNNINIGKAGSGVYVQTSFGSGGHEGWDFIYGGNGRIPSKIIDGKDIYEWLAGLNTTTPPIIVTPPPTPTITQAQYDSVLNLLKIKTNELSSATTKNIELTNQLTAAIIEIERTKIEHQRIVELLNTVSKLICEFSKDRN